MNSTSVFTIGFILIVASLSGTMNIDYIAKTHASNVFKVVDEQGRISFTDIPPSNGQPTTKVKLKPINTQTAVRRPQPKASEKALDKPSHIRYSVSRITQPLNDATVPPGQLNVVVQISLSPKLQDGDLVKLYHNGSTHGAPSSATSFSLTQLIRGQHSIRAEIIGADSRIKAETQTVIFHVKRYHRKN